MPKINFIKVENIFTEAVRQLFISRLTDLAAIVTLIRDPTSSISVKKKQEVVERFQKQLKNLKEQDPKLYLNLNITKAEERKLLASKHEFNQNDWLTIQKLQERIEYLKKQLYGVDSFKAEFEEQIEKERIKHINKRFNVRDGWLPLK